MCVYIGDPECVPGYKCVSECGTSKWSTWWKKKSRCGFVRYGIWCVYYHGIENSIQLDNVSCTVHTAVSGKGIRI